MKRINSPSSGLLTFTLLFGLALVISGAAAPSQAQAALRVQATVNVAPVKARVVIGNGPRVGVIPKPVERRVVVADRNCGCERHDRQDREVVRHRNRHHDRNHRVWVKGQWVKVSPRVSRWIPGHWTEMKCR